MSFLQEKIFIMCEHNVKTNTLNPYENALNSIKHIYIKGFSKISSQNSLFTYVQHKHKQ